jgi:hypothetical protein
MDLFLQLGHGMMSHSKELISKWGDGTAILSPKNMTLDQMLNFSKELNKNNGSLLLDPQFYIPRTSQENLQTHAFWPDNFNTNLFFNGSGVDSMINILLNEYVYPIGAESFIIPTLYLSDITDDWINLTEIILNSISKKNISIPKYLTLCVGEDVLLNEEKTHKLIEIVEDFPVEGFYIIPIHPKDAYLLDSPTWLVNLLDLVASLKILRKKVIVGYSSHQQLLLALAKVDSICSGIWVKTRMFPLKDFDEDDENGGGGRRTTWYYCPQSLSEYQIQFLDVAHRAGILSELEAANSFQSNYADLLFQGAQPSTLNFSEREAFRHYLHCLKMQCKNVSKNSYEETKTYLKLILETASDLAAFFQQNGVRAKYRDFGNVVESSLSVIDAFDNTWGLNFQANWDTI